MLQSHVVIVLSESDTCSSMDPAHMLIWPILHIAGNNWDDKYQSILSHFRKQFPIWNHTMAGESLSTRSHMSDRRYNILDAYLHPHPFDLKIFPGGIQDGSFKLNDSLRY